MLNKAITITYFGYGILVTMSKQLGKRNRREKGNTPERIGHKPTSISMGGGKPPKTGLANLSATEVDAILLEYTHVSEGTPWGKN